MDSKIIISKIKILYKLYENTIPPVYWRRNCDKFILFTNQIVYTFLHINKDFNFFKRLISIYLGAGVSINEANTNKDTLLTSICKHDIDPKIRINSINFLLDKGADPFLPNKENDTAYSLLYILNNKQPYYNKELYRMVKLMPGYINTRSD